MKFACEKPVAKRRKAEGYLPDGRCLCSFEGQESHLLGKGSLNLSFDIHSGKLQTSEQVLSLGGW